MDKRLELRVYDKFECNYWDENTIRQNAEWLLFGEENKEEIEIERSTGLKDKNGKLIYEGDIVKIYAKNRYAYGIYQIKYDFDDCEYDMLDKEGDFIYQLQNDKTKYIEVIGNIHENSDLLELKNEI